MSDSKLVEKVATCLEAFDQRLSAIDQRFVHIEGHLADAAHAGDETSISVANLADSMKKVQQAIVDLGDALDRNTAIMQNFVTETQRLRTSSQQLLSEVRRKLEVAGG